MSLESGFDNLPLVGVDPAHEAADASVDAVLVCASAAFTPGDDAD